jgi:hypothetical protein
MQQLKGFTAANYNPQQWVDLIKATGAGYAVLTTKHHDGVALYPTRLSDLTVIKKTPAARDLVTPFYEVLRKSGLKVGAYYSLLDWSHPDYPNFLKDSIRYKRENDPERWAKFLAFCHGQINEINDLYQPDLWWFDGDWEQPGEVWQAARIREMILQKHPGAIINSRLGEYGDYATPEQNMPITLPDRTEWELCLTPNLNWGYRPRIPLTKHPLNSFPYLPMWWAVAATCCLILALKLMDPSAAANRSIASFGPLEYEAPNGNIQYHRRFARWTFLRSKYPKQGLGNPLSFSAFTSRRQNHGKRFGEQHKVNRSVGNGEWLDAQSRR